MIPKQENIPIKILLADDDKDDRYFFDKAIKEIPVLTEITMVTDGERLMAYLKKNYASLPDVLFLDLNMPRKNGSECLIEIKADPLLQAIPVVLCSTSLGDDFANILYQNGAHYYLHKCDYMELKKCTAQILNLLAESHLQPPREKFILGLQLV